MAALATAGELETHLQRPGLDPVAADQALALATGAVQAYCGWPIVETTETLQVSGSGSFLLTLPTLRLVDVTEVRIDGVLLDPTTYTWSVAGQLFMRLSWPVFAKVEVACTHGFDPVPDVVKLIVLELAARQLSNPEGLQSMASGSVSRTYATAGKPRLSELDERLLQRYAL